MAKKAKKAKRAKVKIKDLKPKKGQTIKGGGVIRNVRV